MIKPTMKKISHEDNDTAYRAGDVMRKSDRWKGVLKYNEKTYKLVLLKPIPGDKRENFKSRNITGEDILWMSRWMAKNGFDPRLKVALLTLILFEVRFKDEEEDIWEYIKNEVIAANWPWE